MEKVKRLNFGYFPPCDRLSKCFENAKNSLTRSEKMNEKNDFSEKREEQWAALAARVGKKHGEAVVEAMKELYDVFGVSIVDWLASLYDPESGAWYYSKSAQETEGYLPNAESTLGGVTMLVTYGATEGRGAEEVTPPWLKKRVSDYVYNLQDPDGYFYHPQWGKNISHLKKSRDLGTCKWLLHMMDGPAPKYTVPGAPKKDGEKYDINNAPERFRSLENYKHYLYEELNFETRAYNSGSEMSSQMGEVEAYGAMLGVDLVDLTLSYITTKECAENGLWHAEKDYYGTNGLQKISKMYNWYNRKIPYAMKALESTMEVIMSDAPVGASVDVYNPWHALGSVVLNLKNQHGLSEDEFAAVMDKVYAWAPAAIRKSAEKMKIFKKDDGGMSYLVKCSSATDQGAKAAVPNSPEGDVNGCGCAMAIIPSIYAGLNMPDAQVPLYTPADWERYIGIVTEREEAYKAGKFVQIKKPEQKEA